MSYQLWTRLAVLPVACSCLASFALMESGFAQSAGQPVANQPTDQAAVEPDAESNDDTDEVTGDHVHLHSAFALRAIPIGTNVALDAGYRMMLSDSESILLKDTYIEAGATTTSSPSNFWGGAYIEALPIAVLKLRMAAQSLQYFGTFGYLGFPDDPANPDWSLDAVGGDPGEGTAASGYLLDAQATLQAKVGNVVVQVPMKYSYINMDVDQAYYESTFDFLLEPTEQMWVVQPMLAYVFVMDDSWLLTGLRWEHAETVQSGFSRDMPALLGLWKLPGSLAGGEMKVVGLGGYWFDHPNRANTPYFATKFSVDWKY
jgi:hypothetical protein